MRFDDVLRELVSGKVEYLKNYFNLMSVGFWMKSHVSNLGQHFC